MNTEYSREELVVLAREIISGKLAPTIIHKLKNILMPITGYAELLEGGASPEKRDIYLKKIEESGRTMQVLLKRFLRFTRPPKGKEGIEVSELIEDIISLFEHYMAVAKVTFKKNIDCSCSISAVYGDISLIFASVLMNAIEAMPQGGEIRVATESRDNGIAISIEDEGEGIGSEIADKIFTPFFTTKKGSLGIGLTVSIFLAKNISGDVIFKPGNKFIISI